MHLNHTMDVIIEGEPYLSKAERFRKTCQFALEKWNEFQIKYGAYAVAPGGTGLFFDDKSPEGWTKPEGRHRFSRPRPGSDADEEISALPRFPKAWDVFGDDLIFDLEFEVKGERHSVSVSELWEGPEINWNMNNALYARIPNPIEAISEIKKKYPTAIIFNEAEEWRLPKGLRVVQNSNYRHL